MTTEAISQWLTVYHCKRKKSNVIKCMGRWVALRKVLSFLASFKVFADFRRFVVNVFRRCRWHVRLWRHSCCSEILFSSHLVLLYERFLGKKCLKRCLNYFLSINSALNDADNNQLGQMLGVKKFVLQVVTSINYFHITLNCLKCWQFVMTIVIRKLQVTKKYWAC